MIVDTADAALVAGALALFVYDSAMLLYADEAVLTRGRRGWSISTGSAVTLGGRFPCLAQAWAPWRPQFREPWNRAPAPEARAPDALFFRALRPLQWVSALQAAWLFVVLPGVLFLHAPLGVLLALAIAIYATSAVGVALAVQRRHALGLTRRSVISLAVDVVACPPFALNIARKACLARGLQAELPPFVAAFLPPAAAAQAAATARARTSGGLDPAFDGTTATDARP